MHQVHSHVRVEPAQDADFAQLAAIVAMCFSDMPVETAINGPPTSSNLEATAQRYRHADRLHRQQHALPAAIKCVYTDPESGDETIVGTAQWYIFPRQRTAQDSAAPHYLLACDWVNSGHERAKITNFFQPFLEGRVRWMGSSPHGTLMYLAVLPAWRRQGIATRCVQWGLDRCQQLGIPAYLEASDLGAPVYEKLGFKTVDRIESEWETIPCGCPIMIKYPADGNQSKG
ncbi:acyl-CoA N-acyltransferase [Microdochium trichocladiopsis]|uniref:Acyl-CoA N-acyltransferase n=1 Tax=Microdochium trichocladiopsis TaxID=1682393 RepID=A0A9P8YAT5_9PEZI|nr:acyl-CoA N-acyltransferase [Microdochium trichocladiopsis]KAH7034540.1 acyl-CoA N-acyltransferase [Microdochium trichocladiopsis]